MTMDQLEFFLAIVSNHTFLEAAESVNLSQSALSKQIMRLEKELDLSLFDRSRRSARLTEAGLTFYEDAKAMVMRYNEMKEHMKPFINRRQDTIHLGTLPFLTQYQLTPLLKKFTEEQPHIRLCIDEVEDDALMLGLDQGTYDLVITRDLLLTKGIYSHMRLAQDELVVLLPQNHPLADRTSVSLSLLSQENFILMPPHVSIHRLCLLACQESGFAPRILRTARLESIISAVASEEGISLVCHHSLAAFLHNHVVCLPLNEHPRTDVVLARRAKEKPSSSCAALIRFFQNLTETQAQGWCP